MPTKSSGCPSGNTTTVSICRRRISYKALVLVSVLALVGPLLMKARNHPADPSVDSRALQSDDGLIDQQNAKIDFPEESLDGIKRCTFEQRKQHLREMCQKRPHALNKKKAVKQLIVSERHQTLFCAVAKVGCSTWKYIIAVQSGKVNGTTLLGNLDLMHGEKANNIGLRRLASYPEKEIQKMLDSYTKVLVARNPLARLYSAYKDKFLMNYDGYAWRWFSKEIKNMKGLPVVHNRRFLSFDRMIDVVIDGRKRKDSPYKGMSRDPHWNDVSELCQPCLIDYDYIAKLETMEQDKGPLLKLFDYPEMPHLNENHENFENRQNPFDLREESLQEAFANVSSKRLQGLFEVFRPDFDLFGYKESLETIEQCSGSDDNG